jgi:hypothetical protein
MRMSDRSSERPRDRLGRWAASMSKADKTAIVGIAIGVGATLAALVDPFELPLVGRHILFWLGIGVTVCGSLYLWDLHHLNKRAAFIRIGAHGVALLLFVAAVLRVEVSKHQLQHPLDNTLSVICDTSNRPDSYRSDRKTYIVQISNPTLPDGTENPLLSSNTFFPAGEGRFNWAGFPVQTFGRCDIINYGDRAVFGANVEMKIAWMEALKVDAGFKSGNTLAVRTAYSPKFDIPAPPNGEVYFYVVNNTKNFVFLEVPDTIKVRTATDTGERDAALIKSSSSAPFNGFFLQPTDWSKLQPMQAGDAAKPSNAVTGNPAVALTEEQKAVIRNEIGRLALKGYDLLAVCSDKSKPVPNKDADIWEKEVRELLSARLGDAYVARLASMPPLSEIPQGFRQTQNDSQQRDREALSFAIYIMVGNLNIFIKELT